MRVYTVHIDPLSPAADREAVLVKEGFSWPACLFGVFWALWHRMWWVAIGLAACEAALGAASYFLKMAPPFELAVEIGAALIIGFVANDLRRMSLGARGFAESAVVAGANIDVAEQRYFDRHLAGAAQPA